MSHQSMSQPQPNTPSTASGMCNLFRERGTGMCEQTEESLCDTEFYKFISDSMSQNIEPFEFKGEFNGETKTIYYLGKMNQARPEIRAQMKSIYSTVRKEWRCNYCSDYIRAASAYFDKNGPIIFRGVKVGDDDTCHAPTLCDGSRKHVRLKSRKLALEMWKLASKIVEPWDAYGNFKTDHNVYNWFPVIVDGAGLQLVSDIESDSVFGKTLFNRSHHVGGFQHYTYCQPTGLPMLTDSFIKKYAVSLKDFTPVFIQMFVRFKDMQQLEDSLRLLIQIIDQSSYASGIKNAVVWFLDIVSLINTEYDGKTINQMNLIKRTSIIASAIFKTSPEEGSNGMVIHWYSQISKNVMDLLENANGEKEMRKMLEDRFSPSNYRRKTAPPKQKHLDVGMEMFATMENTLMTTSELSELPGAHFIQNSTTEDNSSEMTDAMKAMQGMATKGKKKDKYGFASRSRDGTKVTKVYEPTTITELIGLIKTGDITKLEMPYTRGTPMVVVKSNLDPELLKVKHLFGVYDKVKSCNGYFNNTGTISSYTEIDMVYDCKLDGSRIHNLVFIPKNSRAEYMYKPFPYNVTFPEFLSTKAFNQSATFEGFITTTKIRTPTTMDNFAYGISSSVHMQTTGTLTSQLNFKINGEPRVVTINKY